MEESMAEERLLRSIDEVDTKLQDFRKRVKSVLDDLQKNEKVVVGDSQSVSK